MYEAFAAVSTVLSVFFFIAIGVGALVGLRRGAYRSGVKLAANVLSALIALIILLPVKSALVLDAATFEGILSSAGNAINFPLSDIPGEALSLFFEVIAAVIALFIYGTVFFFVRLFMLIPQRIICKRLPRKLTPKESSPTSAPSETYTEVEPKTEGESSVEAVGYAESLENNIGEGYIAYKPEEPAPEPEKASVPVWQKILWHSSAVLAGALSAAVLIGAYLMPFAGIMSRFSDVYSETAVMFTSEDTPEDEALFLEESGRGLESVAASPLISVTDFLYGKTVFEPLLTVRTEHGNINLSKEVETLGGLVSELAQPLRHISDKDNLLEGDGEIIIRVADELAESKLVTYVGSIVIRFAGDSLKPEEQPDASNSEKELNNALVSVIETMTPENFSADIKSVARIADTVVGSELISFLLDGFKEDEGSNADLTPEEIKQEKNEQNQKLFDIIRGDSFSSLLGEIFGIAYDNGHLKSLLVPIVNFGSEAVFSAMEVDIPVSAIDINSVSREAVVAEAGVLCSAIREISAFVDSANQENASVSTYRFDSVGRALDLLKSSIFFGDKYEAIIDSVTSLAKSPEGNTTEDQFMEAVKDAILKSDSAEKLLGSAQSVVIIQEQLKATDKKGSENEELVSALETLSKNDSASDKETLKELVSDILDIGAESEENKETNEILNDAVSVTTDVMSSDTFDAAKEADALQAIYDITHSETTDIIAAVESEERLAEVIANSEIAISLFDKLNAEGKDYGINEKLTPENRTEISKAVDNLNVDEAKKQTIKDFFKIK